MLKKQANASSAPNAHAATTVLLCGGAARTRAQPRSSASNTIAAADARANDSSRAPSGHAAKIARAVSTAATTGASQSSAVQRARQPSRVANSTSANASTR